MIAKVVSQHAIDSPLNRNPTLYIFESIQPFLKRVNAGCRNECRISTESILAYKLEIATAASLERRPDLQMIPMGAALRRFNSEVPGGKSVRGEIKLQQLSSGSLALQKRHAEAHQVVVGIPMHHVLAAIHNVEVELGLLFF